MTNERPTILIADDERLNRVVLAELLQAEHTVLLAKNGEDALRLAQASSHELAVILLDVSMPRMDGYQVLAALKADPLTADIAVIFITGKNQEADEETGLRLGAADYVSKPIRPAIVHARVRNQVRLAIQRQALARLAQQDGLTRLANRRHFDDAYAQACRRALRHGESFGLLMFDIDHFKQYNDHYGHIAGDEALRQVAGLLSTMARRPGDLAARYGGEEFILLMAGGGDVPALAEKFRSAVEQAEIAHARSATARHLTISGGAVLLNAPGDTERALPLADALLYRSKAGGRNRITFAEI